MGDQEGGKPLAIDLFCGLGGWTEGLLAEGYYVVGFDIEAAKIAKIPITLSRYIAAHYRPQIAEAA